MLFEDSSPHINGYSVMIRYIMMASESITATALFISTIVAWRKASTMLYVLQIVTGFS